MPELLNVSLAKNEVSRRSFLRTPLKYTGIFLLAANKAACSADKDMKERDLRDLPSWLTVEDLESIGLERAKKAIEAARQWNQRYTSGRRIKIAPLDIKEEEILPDGRIAVTLETAEPGIIKLGREGDPRKIVLHAMTHATKPDTPALLDNPMPFPDGFIKGYHGLNILVALRNGEQTNFTKMEEGMAERNASAFPGYSVESASYFAVGNLARSHFPFERFRFAHDWAKSNDVPALVRARLNLPFGAPITIEHILSVMDEYNQAWINALRQQNTNTPPRQ